MHINRTSLIASSLLILGLAANSAPAFAGQWYFYVENASSATIKKLYASEDGKKWGYFDIGSGIGAGKSIKLNWSSSTDDQSCKQYLKAVFADGSESKSAKIDFCNDLDDPIVFND
jgi:hypothetical protein